MEGLAHQGAFPTGKRTQVPASRPRLSLAWLGPVGWEPWLLPASLGLPVLALASEQEGKLPHSTELWGHQCV